jgi:hypothetical protein
MEACSMAFLLGRYLRDTVDCTVYILKAGKLQMIWKSTRKTDKEEALYQFRFLSYFSLKFHFFHQMQHKKQHSHRTSICHTFSKRLLPNQLITSTASWTLA